VFFFSYISVNYNILIRSVFVSTLMMSATLASATEVTTLRQSVDYALNHNRLLEADNGTVEQARAGEDMATSHFMPRLDLSTGVVRTDSPGNYFGTKLNQQRIQPPDFNPAFLNNPGFINNYQTSLQLNMPIYQGGALWAGRKQAGHQTEAAEFNHNYMQQQVIFQTIHAYARTRQAKAAIHAMETAVSAAEKRHQDTLALQKRGILIDSDVMDARVHLLRSQLKLKQANNAYAQAKEELQRIMGLDSTTALSVEDEPNLLLTLGTLDQSIEKSMLSRPDLKALEQSYQASEASIELNRAAFLPHVGLVAGQEWNASTAALRSRNSMIGATISMNLFSGGYDQAQMRASRAKEVALGLKIADHKQQIHNEVTHAWRMLDESRSRHSSEREALKQSEESLRIKSLRYQQGLAKTSDLLDAQMQVDTTRLSSIQARYDITIAQAALQLATGTLNIEVIQ